MRVSESGHISHQGSNFYMSEIYAGRQVGLFKDDKGVIELHYVNLHLGNLEFNCTDPYSPDRLIIKSDQAPNASGPSNQKTK